MTTLKLVIDRDSDWKAYYPSDDVTSAQRYIDESPLTPHRIINLCRNYQYQSRGYYVSLLAEARGHKVIPSVKTLTDLAQPAVYGVLDHSIQKPLNTLAGEETRWRWNIYFGQCEFPGLAEASRQLFERFPVPILSVTVHKKTNWQLASIKALGLHSLSEPEEGVFAESLERFSRKVWRAPRAQRRYRYDLAILINDKETTPPSDKGALKKKKLTK